MQDTYDLETIPPPPSIGRIQELTYADLEELSSPVPSIIPTQPIPPPNVKLLPSVSVQGLTLNRIVLPVSPSDLKAELCLGPYVALGRELYPPNLLIAYDTGKSRSIFIEEVEFVFVSDDAMVAVLAVPEVRHE